MLRQFVESKWHKRLLNAFFLLSRLALISEISRNPVYADNKTEEALNLRQKILDLANSYHGQGDGDGAKQRSLTILVDRLIALSPQAAVKDRLKLLHGVWKQAWGAYDYRNDKRGVDPELGVDEIYQVVSEKGYYYNVSPLYDKGDRTRARIGLLRGEYRLDPHNPNLLRIKFTKYPGVRNRPTELELWELPAFAESGNLRNRTTIVPTIIVKLFFGGGALREVYTDENLRILYGSDGKHFDKEFIYVMTRVKNEQP